MSTKTFFLFTISFVSVIFFATSCNNTDSFNTGNTVIYMKVKGFKSNTNDSVIYSSNDFLWFNATSKELKFVNNPTLQKLQPFQTITFYHGKDSLFTATVVNDLQSFIKNDLVLRFNLTNGLLYLEDGYPMSITSPLDINERAQKRAIRSAAWNTFIVQMKKDKHYVEK